MSQVEHRGEQNNSFKGLSTGGPTLILESAGQRYGLPVANVLKIAGMVSIVRLPKAPDIVVGVIDFHGQVIPVIDMRWRLREPTRPYTLRVSLVISRLNGRIIGLAVDAVRGVVNLQPDQVQTPTEIFTPTQALQVHHLSGVARVNDNLVLLLNPDTFLSLEEEAFLENVLPDGEA